MMALLVATKPGRLSLRLVAHSAAEGNVSNKQRAVTCQTASLDGLTTVWGKKFQLALRTLFAFVENVPLAPE